MNADDFYVLPDSFYVTRTTQLAVGSHNGDSLSESEVAARVGRLRNGQLRSANKTFAADHLCAAEKQKIGTVAIPAESGNLLLSPHLAPNSIELVSKVISDLGNGTRAYQRHQVARCTR